MDSWNKALKRLQELQKKSPRPLIIELIYKDNESEILPLEEVLKMDSNAWIKFRVVEGGRPQDIKDFLGWLAPSVIE